MMNENLILTNEQQAIVEAAERGTSILCDACWGSGKTTVLQEVNKVLKIKGKNILYLTYNKQLKEDARAKFDNNTGRNIHNYDAWARQLLTINHIEVRSANGAYAKELVKHKDIIPSYDIVLIDEYQDISKEHAELIEELYNKNNNIQFIVVGDCDQKISKQADINHVEFFKKLLAKLPNGYEQHNLTISFRLNNKLAKVLSQIYDKPITGTNNDLDIKFLTTEQAIEVLGTKDPKNVLILGCAGTNGAPSNAKYIQNKIEAVYPDIYNKKTLYSCTAEEEGYDRCSTWSEVGLDITYDKCKGLERDTVILGDFTEDYFSSRVNHAPFAIIKNLFCVALTRAKKNLIVITDSFDRYSEKYCGQQLLKPKALQRPGDYSSSSEKLDKITVGALFDYKPSHLVNKCLDYIKITSEQKPGKIINIKNTDDLIDLSMCIGKFMEYTYFKKMNIDKELELVSAMRRQEIKSWPSYARSLESKIKYISAVNFSQDRYKNAKLDISTENKKAIITRLNKEFTQNFEDIQKRISIEFNNGTELIGISDCIKNNIVYELKFTSQITDKAILQCATYMLALGLPGIVWNIRTDEKIRLEITNKKAFKNALEALINIPEIKYQVKTGKIFKQADSFKSLLSYTTASGSRLRLAMKQKVNSRAKIDKSLPSAPAVADIFAIIDTETNIYNTQAISIGIAIVDREYNVLDYCYLIDKNILNEDNTVKPSSGMYAHSIFKTSYDYQIKPYSEMIEQTKALLEKYNIKTIFAYNAAFDHNILAQDLPGYFWRDIMSLCRNKVFNKVYASKTTTGRWAYGAEAILRQLTCDRSYREKHTAIDDTMDELLIMKCLNEDLNKYKEHKLRIRRI